MTVKEICEILGNPKCVNLSAEGFCYTIKDSFRYGYDPVMMAAFGDCKVRNLVSIKECEYELALAIDFVKEAHA